MVCAALVQEYNTCFGVATQVSLFQGQPACAARRAPLTLKSALEPGMKIAAYFRTEHDSAALHQKVQAALRSCLKDPAAVGSEYASHCSTAIYLHVRARPKLTAFPCLMSHVPVIRDLTVVGIS